MSRDEMLLRFGFYCALAESELGDQSYERRWLGRAHELTEESYSGVTAEIQQRLVAAGKLSPDQDPWELFIRGAVSRS